MFFNMAVATPEGIVRFLLLGIARASNKNIYIYFSLLYFVHVTICVGAKIIGSLGKMTAYFFIQICFK